MQHSQTATIGIDIGTSGCRGIAIDKHRAVITSHRIDYSTQELTTLATTEQDPQQLWSIVLTLLDAVIADCVNYEIIAISVDATSGSVLFVDNAGQTLTPILLYSDNRCHEQARQISKVAPKTSAAQGMGSGLAKASFLVQHYSLPDTAKLLHQADWINHQLGASLGLTDENNALKTGFDPITSQWSSWVGKIIPTHFLPDVVTVGTVIGSLPQPLCHRFNLQRSPKIIAGTTDSVAAFIATGANQLGDAVTSLGSTMVCKVISDKAIFDADLGIYSHRLGDHWLVGGASNTGGAVLSHFFTDQQLTQLSEKIELNQATFDYYPLLKKGERFPVNDPNLMPRLEPRPEQDSVFLHGLLQGIANIERHAYDCLASVGTPQTISVRTVGGGAKSAMWTKIRQNTLNLPIVNTDNIEAAYGSALIAQGILTTNTTRVKQ